MGNARQLYELDVKSGAYGERRWTIMPIVAFILVLLALIGLLLRDLLPGYWLILVVFVASVVLLSIPIIIKRLKHR